MRHLTVTTVVI